jgi:superfamily II helicase
MGVCALCSNGGEGTSLLEANHKEHGRIMICRDCWQELYRENRMVYGSTCSGKCSTCAR